MDRATPKKLPNGPKPPKAADISNFFRKTPSDQSVPRRASGNGTVLEDIKPNVTVNARSRKGKEKVVGGDTSADPVVISSDEDDSPVNTVRAKRQRTATVPRTPVPVPDLPCSPGAGPSRSRSPLPELASCSPPPGRFGPSPPPRPESPRPAFAGLPDFQPPPAWPSIINTASNPQDIYDDNAADDDDVVGLDNGDDADSQHPGMFEEDDTATQDPGDDRDDAEADDSGLDIPVEEVPPDQPDLLPNGTRRGSIDLTMEWDEGDDEGMGMEEPDDYDDPPNRPGSRGGAKRNGVLQSDNCPVCSASMKGKAKNVSHGAKFSSAVGR